MKLKTLLVVSAVLSGILGIAFLVIPGMFMSFLGEMGSATPTQVLGANFIGFAVLNYFARNVQDVEALRSIVLANLVSDVLGLILGVYAQLTSGGMWFGWLSIAIYLLLVLGFGYFLMTRPRSSLVSMSR